MRPHRQFFMSWGDCSAPLFRTLTPCVLCKRTRWDSGVRLVDSCVNLWSTIWTVKYEKVFKMGLICGWRDFKMNCGLRSCRYEDYNSVFTLDTVNHVHYFNYVCIWGGEFLWNPTLRKMFNYFTDWGQRRVSDGEGWKHDQPNCISPLSSVFPICCKFDSEGPVFLRNMRSNLSVQERWVSFLKE